jgi:hypothetical protein
VDLENALKQADIEIAVRDDDERPRYVLRNASFALSDLPPIEWIVGEMISAGSVSMFYGEPGSKKTYALLSMAICVAMGKPWLGQDVKPCKVLIVDEESGERRLALRLGLALRGEFGDENTPIEFVSLAGFKLDDKEDRKELQLLIEATGAGLVIIDALADVMDGDENSKQDTQPVFTALRKLAEATNAAIIIIHHSNKAGGYRGSSAIKGALDLMVKITSEDGSDWITFKSEKTRDGEAVQFMAVAKWTESQFYLTPAEKPEKAKKLTPSQTATLEYIKKHGPLPIKEIASHAESCSPDAARQAVYALARLGLAYRTSPDAPLGRGSDAIYAAAEEAGEEVVNDDEN